VTDRIVKLFKHIRRKTKAPILSIALDRADFETYRAESAAQPDDLLFFRGIPVTGENAPGVVTASFLVRPR